MIDGIKREVGERQPVDEREARSIEHLLVELDRLADPCNEQADPVHLTASGIVVGPRGVLLHRHKRLGLWLQPGGHIDPGETPAEAAHREVIEETGLHPPPTDRLAHVDVHPGPKGHTHLDLRYLFEVDGDPAPAEGESQDVKWFDWPAALETADPGLAGFLRWYCGS